MIEEIKVNGKWYKPVGAMTGLEVMQAVVRATKEEGPTVFRFLSGYQIMDKVNRVVVEGESVGVKTENAGITLVGFNELFYEVEHEKTL